MKDVVQVADRLRALVRSGASNEVLSNFVYGETDKKEMVQIEGRVSLQLRERGKKIRGGQRGGNNIWTLTGREHLAQLQSYSSYGPPVVAARADRIRYVGFGTGSTPEVSSVSRLVTPIAFDSGNNFLAQLSLPTYPLSPSRSTVRYSRTFSEVELSVSGSVTLTEAGIFTDGDPGSSFAPGTRDVTLANAASQAPNGYKVFEPLSKTQNFVLEVSWEVRF